MSQTNSKGNYSNGQSEITTLNQKIDLSIPNKVLDKIKYLCMQINTVEWSGILFYSIKGGIKDPKNMKITIEDILPMDRGNGTFTKYELDERFVEYIMEDPKHADYFVGHVHSHHNMPVYFSGTDKSELVDNSAAHNFYLSLIVNNHMNMVAKVAFRGRVSVTQTIPVKALDEAGEEYVIGTKDFSAQKEYVYVYDCDIKSKAEGVVVPPSFADKVKNLKSHMTPKPNKAGFGWQRNSAPAYNAQKSFQQNQQKTKQQQGIQRADMFSKTFTGPGLDGVDDEDAWYEEVEVFLKNLFQKVAYTQTEFKSLDEALNYIETKRNFKAMQLAKSVLRHYVNEYKDMYPQADTNDFTSDLEMAIQILDAHTEIYPDLVHTVESLTNMQNEVYAE